VTVPPAEIGNLINAVEKIAKKYDVHLPMYGHAADDNLHIHLLKEENKQSRYIEK